VALRLFVPESWTSNPVRLKRAGVPVEHRAARTKPEIALAEIDRVIASGVRFGCVLADSGYGSSGPFRQALSERGLLWAVGLSRRQNVYPAEIALIFPIAKIGKPRKYHIPDQPPVSAEALLAEGKWQRVSWRRGTKGRLTCLFTARRVRVADGHKHRMLNNRMQCMPGDEVWLVGERRSTGEQKYYVSNLPADATIKTLAATIKARWVCEQAHQQLKEELGLDHFEGRSWTGLHRHALTTMIAYAFLQSRRLKAAGRKKKILRTATNQACRPSGKTQRGRSRNSQPSRTRTVTLHSHPNASPFWGDFVLGNDPRFPVKILPSCHKIQRDIGHC
jgi:SRSO17 transposase